MCVRENYIDDIFKNHAYKESIKKYVFNEIDSIDFNPDEIIYSMSNDHNIYSKLLDIYLENKNDESILRLFKIISLHYVENIYIFEILIINMISGISIKESLLKCISLEKINNWNREYKRHSYSINPISNEIMNAKMHISIYYYYAQKYFPKETDEYMESICNSNIDEIIEEYKDNILIALMAISIKIYYGDYEKIGKILEYSDKVNYLDYMLSLLLIIDLDDNIKNKFAELLENNILNKNNDLLVNLAYLIRIFFLIRKNFSKKLENKSFNEFINYLEQLNMPKYFVFLVEYLDYNIFANSNKIFDGVKLLYENDKTSFYELYEILKHVNIPYIIELKVILTCILLIMNDENADMTILDNNIDYFINNIKKDLEKVYQIKSENIFELLSNEKIDKYDLSVELSNDIIFSTRIIVIMYDYNENARKVVRALLKSLPYNLAIPIMIKERKQFFNIKLKEILEYLQGYELDLKDLIITYLFTYPMYIFKPKYILNIVNKNADHIVNMFNDKVFLKAVSYKSYALIDFLELLYNKNKA